MGNENTKRNRIIKDSKSGYNLIKRENIRQRIELRKRLIRTIGKCESCNRNINLTLDDIIPQSLLKQLGIDPEVVFLKENFQLLCYGCNQFKSDRLDFRNPKTKKLLLKYLKDL